MVYLEKFDRDSNLEALSSSVISNINKSADNNLYSDADSDSDSSYFYNYTLFIQICFAFAIPGLLNNKEVLKLGIY